MRGVGISGAGMDADMGGMEDVDPEAEPAPVDGGAGAAPDTTTGTPPVDGGEAPPA
jgi:hypothetical protein